MLCYIGVSDLVSECIQWVLLVVLLRYQGINAIFDVIFHLHYSHIFS